VHTEDEKNTRKNPYEAEKLRYDFFKHLTTLSSGAIIITGTVVSALLDEPVWLEVVGVSCCLFLISILGSLTGMVFKIQGVEINEKLDRGDASLFRKATFVSLFGFYFGICSLILFFWLNLRS